MLLAGMVARAVGLTMLTEVGNVWAGRRHEPADSRMVARDRVASQVPSMVCEQKFIVRSQYSLCHLTVNFIHDLLLLQP